MKMDSSFGGGPRRRSDLLALMAEPVEVTRTVVIAGARRSVRLEADIWDAFKEIAKRNGATISQECERFADQISAELTLATAIRVYVLKNLKTFGGSMPI